MKPWILAAGLLSIAPLSDAMLWLNPPTTVDQGYDLADIHELNDLVARETETSRSAPTGGYGACALRKKLGLTPCGERK